MPNESQNKIKRTKPAPKTEDIQKVEEVPASATVEEPRTKFVPKDIDPNQYVTVRNGFQGKLERSLSGMNLVMSRKWS